MKRIVHALTQRICDSIAAANCRKRQVECQTERTTIYRSSIPRLRSAGRAGGRNESGADLSVLGDFPNYLVHDHPRQTRGRRTAKLSCLAFPLIFNADHPPFRLVVSAVSDSIDLNRDGHPRCCPFISTSRHLLSPLRFRVRVRNRPAEPDALDGLELALTHGAL